MRELESLGPLARRVQATPTSSARSRRAPLRPPLTGPVARGQNPGRAAHRRLCGDSRLRGHRRRSHDGARREGRLDRRLCLPDVGSPALFSRLLDSERGGSFRLEPTRAYEVERTYKRGSNVLETTFTTSQGSGPAHRRDDADGRPPPLAVPRADAESRGAERHGGPPLDVRAALRVRRAPPSDHPPRGALVHRNAARTRSRSDSGMQARSKPGRKACKGSSSSQPARRPCSSLSASHEQPVILPGPDDTERRIARTDRFWQDWSDRVSTKATGERRSCAARSSSSCSSYAPSGAIVAAPTASLPEWVGGGRNWDYRYTWLRDASWTLDAFVRLGSTMRRTRSSGG